MKRILLILALTALACTQKKAPLQSGDLLFVGIPAAYSMDDDTMESAIGAATSDASSLNIIHVAILDIDSLGTWIIDATIKRGVDRHPLDTMLRDFRLRNGQKANFIVKRLKRSRGVGRYVENAKEYLGRSYNTTFLPNDTSLYCSELVQRSYVTLGGKELFREVPMNWRDADGELPEYWVKLFASLGMEVPEGLPGTNPQEMSEEPVLKATKVKIDQPY